LRPLELEREPRPLKEKTMPVDLTVPLDWKNAAGDAETMLEQLQANILRPHVREHLSVLFVNFGDATEGRAFLRALAPMVKSAKQHLDEVEAFHTNGINGTTYVGVGLTASGYAALGIVAGVPSDPSFLRGMKAPASKLALHDPPVSTWDAPYRGDIHAVVLVGDATDGGMTATRNAVLDLLTDNVTVVGEETGLGQHNSSGDGVEHFGYVDGRSQPLFLTQDIADEATLSPAPTLWDPAFALDRVLVPDNAAPNPDVDFGSYFVFRKLEQNVRRFKQAEQDLADQLGLIGDDRERAGAMLIGRFEDGTPVTVQPAAGEALPVANNFNYDQDPDGLKCPFHGHIRKSNPRGSGGFEAPLQERLHIMARRGQTYGQRIDDPDGEMPPSARPTGGVGLLFMAFNVDIGQQFDFVQQRWVDSANFPKVSGSTPPPGLDQVIGQGPRDKISQPRIWNAMAAVEVDPAPQAVTMKGGEYFFTPSLDFLNTV